MVLIRVNKMEAARRQIDAAIRMLFNGDDPVAIHTVAAAAFRVVRDLCEKKGSNMQQTVSDLIRPGMENKFWHALNRLSNFLKHADHDPFEIHDEFEEEVNDGFLFLGCLYYADLGNQYTLEMTVMTAWYTALNPGFLKDTAPSGYKEFFQSQDWLRRANRAEQLRFGRQLLDIARLSGSTR